MAAGRLPYGIAGLKSHPLVLVGICSLAGSLSQQGWHGWQSTRVKHEPPGGKSTQMHHTFGGDVAAQSIWLLMFACPHCPCTAASLGELARLMSRCMSDVDAIVYFYRPDSMPDDWVVGNLWNSAAAIPGVQVRIDPQGMEAARFGSRTSGEVLLYDTTGQPRFHGGITPRRGHEGVNLGKSTVISIVKGDRTNVDHCPAFGCALFIPRRRASKTDSRLQSAVTQLACTSPTRRPPSALFEESRAHNVRRHRPPVRPC